MMKTLLDLKTLVCRANLELVAAGLVFHTWGNVSGVDRERGVMVIKPSGVPYDELTPEGMVVVRLEDGEVAEGVLKPSSDTATHLVLYRAFGEVGSVVHTHSLYATAWAQAARDVPALGTTHADYFHGPVPCTRPLTEDEIAEEYEANTGHTIVERFGAMEAMECPGVLVASHGPFAWGRTPDEAVHHAVVLEHLARLASETLRIAPDTWPMPRALLDKHFLRKHGPAAYYGQSRTTLNP
jgi:L-ribulose-5-phosphate 4-epimerase